MTAETESLTFKQKTVLRMFELTRLLCDPGAFARDEERRAHNEMEERLKFYLLHDINRSSTEIGPETVNMFSDAEREKYFGKARLAMEDITWEKLEKLLLPREEKGSVFRVNEALQGSHFNECFSRILVDGSEDRASVSHVEYVPRTVTVYDDEGQAKAAAKILRMLTAQSGATIFAEPIERGMAEPLWVVSDNMDLATHNALRLLFTHLSHKQTPQEREEWKNKVQIEVNKRLPEGMDWEAYEGVGTLLTLAGRPGVKMYKRLANGKDDPIDREHVNRIPHQATPIYVRGVPHRSVYASDGRRLTEPGNTHAIIGHLLLGPDGWAMLHGDRYAMGHVIRESGKELAAGITDSPSAFGKGKALADIAATAMEPASELLGYVAGGASVLVTGTGMLLCSLGYKAVKGVGNRFYKDGNVDPIENRFLPYVRRVAVDPTAPQFSKHWLPRETGEAIKVRPEELTAMVKPLETDELPSPLGAVKLPARDGDGAAAFRWPVNVGTRFNSYMTANHCWPDIETLTAHGKFRLPEDNGLSEYSAARKQLAHAYANWIKESYGDAIYLARKPGAPLPPDDALPQVSELLADKLNNFIGAIQSQQSLPGDSANHITEVMREALRKGMEGFLQEQHKAAARG